MYVIKNDIRFPPCGDKLMAWFNAEGFNLPQNGYPRTFQDRSGSGATSDPTDSTRVDYKENLMNSRGGIYFNGGSFTIPSSRYPLSYLNFLNGEIFIVFSPTLIGGTGNDRGLVSLKAQSSTTYGIDFGYNDAGAGQSIKFKIGNSGGTLATAVTATTLVANAKYLFHLSLNLAPDSTYLYKNGVQIGAAARSAGDIGYSPTTAFRVGLGQGAYTAGAVGNFMELVILNGNINADEKKMMEDYFNSKYAIF